MQEKLSNVKQAIVIAHVMRRFLCHFEPHERTSHIDILLKRLTKMLKKRERTNKAEFIFATEFERVLWQNVTDKYDKNTPILGIDFVTSVYTYFPQLLRKHAFVSEKLMESVGATMNEIEVENSEIVKMESNGSDLLSTFIKEFEPYSGVALRKSLFAGKKLTIMNNLVIEGKQVSKQFA